MAGNTSLLPNLQPLSQHLTQLCIQQPGYEEWRLDEFSSALQPLAQLQVLTISEVDLRGVSDLLQALPQLHTLQLPDAAVEGQEQLDMLLAATQLTSIQLGSLEGLTSSAAVHNLTQACRVPVRIKKLWLNMAALQQVDSQQLVAVLQALDHCSWGTVCVAHKNVGAADVATLAPLCQGCTQLVFAHGSLTPSLVFWRQLVQLMPTVTDVVFKHVEGSTSSAMHESLQLMAKQPWARWLDICISPPFCSPELPACWQASPLSLPGRLRVGMKDVDGNIMSA
ncbi:hypothetical protein V8C86DRAFT_2778069 [Haematococcus lacustris]